MKKVLMILTVVGVFALTGCQEDENLNELNVQSDSEITNPASNNGNDGGGGGTNCPIGGC